MAEPVKPKEPMHWDRLRDAVCPKDRCYGSLVQKDKGYECSKDSCAFFVRTERFDQIITSIYEAEQNIKSGFGKKKGL